MPRSVSRPQSTLNRWQGEHRFALGAFAFALLCSLQSVALLAQSMTQNLPIDIVIPSNFHRLPDAKCCSATVRLVAAWSTAPGSVTEHISILEEAIESRLSLHSVIADIALWPGQSITSVAYEKSCGRSVALVTSTGQRNGRRVDAVQAIIVSGLRVVTVTYDHPGDDPGSKEAVAALRRICWKALPV